MDVLQGFSAKGSELAHERLLLALDDCRLNIATWLESDFIAEDFEIGSGVGGGVGSVVVGGHGGGRLEKPRLRWRGLLNAPDGEEWQVRRGNDQYRSPGLVSQCLASRTEGICQVACRVACITATRMTMCRCS